MYFVIRALIEAWFLCLEGVIYHIFRPFGNGDPDRDREGKGKGWVVGLACAHLSQTNPIPIATLLLY